MTILIHSLTLQKFLQAISTFGLSESGVLADAENLDALKVIICESIIHNNEEQLQNAIHCLSKVNDYVQLESLSWLLYLAKHKERKKHKGYFPIEVIRQNNNFNKLDPYGKIETFIIQKIKEICPEVD